MNLIIPKLKKGLASRLISLSIMVLVMMGIYPQRAMGQEAIPSQLEFFVYPPNWNYPYDDIVGKGWLLTIKDGQSNSLTGHLDVPYTYSGRDEHGDHASMLVKVIWNLSSNISSVNIPWSIEIIGDNSFLNCTKLKSVVIPNNVKWVGDNAFAGCGSLTSVVVSPENVCYTSFSGCDIKKGAYPVGKRAFVADIEVAYPNECIPDPNGLIYNPNHTSFYFAPWDIEELDLPASVTAIGPKALAGCSKLKTLRVDATTPPSVSADSFDGAIIRSLEVPKGCKDIYANDINWSKFASVIKEVNTGIVLNQTEINLKSTESYQLNAKIENPSVFESKIGWTSSDEAVATVDSDGMIKARSVGKAVIKATYEDLSAECVVNVGATAPASITLSSTKVQLKVSKTIDFILKATVYPESTTDQTIVWSSSNPDVADVVNYEGYVYVRAKSLGNAIITASCGDVKATCEVEVIETKPERVSIYWKCDNLEVGQSFQFRANVQPETTTDKTIIWSSSDVAVASVDETGLVVAHSVGSVTITATCGNVSGQRTINVIPVPASSITLNHSSVELKGIDSVQLTATILPIDASGLPVAWTSSNEEIVTVDETGLVTSIKSGNAVVTATCGSVKATCNVTVWDVSVLSITLNYTKVILKKGDSIQLIAEAYPENAIDKILWGSGDENIVTVDTNGVLTAVGTGETYIVVGVERGSVVKFCGVTVVDEEDIKIVLNKSAISLDKSQSFQLTATLMPAITIFDTVDWSSDNESVATVDESGLITAISPGETTITATCGEVSSTCKVTVNPIHASDIILNITNTYLLIGETANLTASIEPEDTTDPSIAWKSDNEAVATVSADGVITAISVGTATITATCGEVSATCQVTVNPVTASDITLNVSDLSLLVGATDKLTATVEPANTTDATITWKSDNEDVVTVSAEGVITAISVGTATITATCGEVSATCQVTV
ncbi:MAG: Ig-like domain-containing protein, partial [Muribaculaceae bacterium]|nr:Ig-like domain-containing protein [Muribaculaceae bacterium]